MAQFSAVLVTAAPFQTGGESVAALTKVDGREALLRSVELFLNRDEIKQIQLVVPPEMLEEIKKKHGGHLGFSGVKVASGVPRFGEQIAAAADKLSADCSHVIVHDVARCCVAYTDIDALLATADGKAGITALCMPVRNGMCELDEGGNPVGMVLPSRFSQIVMPLLFTKAKFLELAKAKRDPHASELTLLKGSSLNFRVGGGADAAMAKSLLAMMPKPKPKAASSPFEEAQW